MANYKIGGCNVKFPHQAYGTQLSFMGKVIQALDQGHNALLEAPTGSGKTLSLLCGSLAWQQREKQRIEEGVRQHTEQARAYMTKEGEAAQQRDHADDDDNSDNTTTDNNKEEEKPLSQRSTPKQDTNPTTAATTATANDDDSQHLIRVVGVQPTDPEAAQQARDDVVIQQGGGFLEDVVDTTAPTTTTPSSTTPLPPHLATHPPLPPPPRRTAPKIFYATRTHSQIAQVVKELKRSGYAPRMVILASKQQYCVNDHARSKPSLDEECENLLRTNACDYFRGVQMMVRSGGGSSIMAQVHDIEDLCDAGKRRKACPYYVARATKDEAEILFGPYNYFVDPIIRRAMGLDSIIENSVIIFDEAHNIEDVCREAASLDVERISLMSASIAVQRALAFNGKPQVYGVLKGMLDKVLEWIDGKERQIAAQHHQYHGYAPRGGGGGGGRDGGGRKNSRFADNGGNGGVYEHMVGGGLELRKELERMGFFGGSVDALWEAYEDARAEDEALASNKEDGKGGRNTTTTTNATTPQDPQKPASAGKAKPVRVGSNALGLISRVIQVVKMIYQVSEDGGRDYRMAIKRQPIELAGPEGQLALSRAKTLFLPPSSSASQPSPIGSVPTPTPTPTHLFTLSLWCMNPAVAFKQLSSRAHSIILTSGTLSPLNSFASELGAPFSVRLEAPHVVNMAKQVWAGVMTSAPSGEQVVATYQHNNKPEFMDNVGNIVVQMCSTIPDGVLLFLPSYSLLDRLVYRWKATGVYRKLTTLKKVVHEPRTGGAEALQTVMRDYYQAISTGHGGLFMAVCRGKVSEGLDFADANARGVVVVGIPFPNVKDMKVDAKKKFNDTGCRNGMGLLSGHVWYEQQAMRALNQALGRCIRHRNDWGGIVLIDARFQHKTHQEGLSRWVRSSIRVFHQFDEGMDSLKTFYHRLGSSGDVGGGAVRVWDEEDKEKENSGKPVVNAFARMMGWCLG